MKTSNRPNYSSKVSEGFNIDSITATSISVDWSEVFKFDEDNENGSKAWAVEECQECGRAHLLTFTGNGREGDAKCNELAPEIENDEGDEVTNTCEGYVAPFEGPMMNAFWPCDIRGPEAAARAIAHLPLCVVEYNGEVGFALTGGGMNLAWEIAEAYMAAGFLPPTAIRLPRMAGRPEGKRDAWIMAGLKRSNTAAMQWLRNNLRDLADLRAYGKREAAEKKAKS